MKAIRKFAVILSMLCFCVFGSVLKSYAAEGTIMFSDPETKVGETVSVDMVVQTAGEAIGDADIILKYDASALEFVSGTDVQTDGTGQLKYAGKGTGTESELRSTLEFKALKAGDTTITVESCTAYLYSDESLNCVEGSSAVKIEAGADGSTSVASGQTTTASESNIKVMVDGVEYSLSESFTVAVIPEGYKETKMIYSGAERKFVSNDRGVTLGYLVDSAGEGKFFLYNAENATFTAYVELKISDNVSIILLNEASGISLPEQYQEIKLNVSENTFPAWQDVENDGYYVLYALNTSSGAKELYQYDKEDETYQRFIMPSLEEKETETDNTFLGKVKSFVDKFFTLVLLGGVVLVLFMLILIIVLAVKVLHRNQEIDDLYEEYNIPDEEPEDEVRTTKKFKKRIAEDDEYFDDDYIETDEDDEFDEYDDEYDEDGYEENDEDEDFEIDFIDL